jgi:hypothetical protein
LVPKALPEVTLRLISSIQASSPVRATSSPPTCVRSAPILLEEIDGIERGPCGQEVVAGGVAEVGSVRRGADVGRNAGLVDADNVRPAALDQVMRDRSADDTAETDDDDLCLVRKS